jgi:hypothetical protein
VQGWVVGHSLAGRHRALHLPLNANSGEWLGVLLFRRRKGRGCAGSIPY